MKQTSQMAEIASSFSAIDEHSFSEQNILNVYCSSFKKLMILWVRNPGSLKKPENKKSSKIENSYIRKANSFSTPKFRGLKNLRT